MSNTSHKLRRPTLSLCETPHSRVVDTLFTLAGPEGTVVVLVLDLLDNAMVVAADTATLVTSETTFVPSLDSFLMLSAGAGGAVGHNRCLFAFHDSGPRVEVRMVT